MDDLDMEEDSLGGLSIVFHSEIITEVLDPRGLYSLRLGHLQSQKEVKWCHLKGGVWQRRVHALPAAPPSSTAAFKSVKQV